MAPDDKIRNTVRNHIHNVVCDNEKKEKKLEQLHVLFSLFIYLKL